MKLIKIWKDDSRDFYTNITVSNDYCTFEGIFEALLNFFREPSKKESKVTTYYGHSVFRNTVTGNISFSDKLENWVWLYSNNASFKKEWAEKND